jgi:hypothetical protein
MDHNFLPLVVNITQLRRLGEHDSNNFLGVSRIYLGGIIPKFSVSNMDTTVNNRLKYES